MGENKIGFEQTGIGDTLQKSYRLKVPLNQREYSWEEEHAVALFDDLSTAFAKGDPHFLGTIVLTRVSPDVVDVADGQQRLATTAMLLAAIRDFLIQQGDAKTAHAIEQDYLLRFDRKAKTEVPRLSLNVDDGEFFQNRVLMPPDRRTGTAVKASHRRIESAFAKAQAYVRQVAEEVKPAQQNDRLNEWVDFLTHKADVILLTVPDDQNAFRMFETLNDRGLKASQADLLKNYLLSKADEDDKLVAAQQRWARMLGATDGLGQPDMPVTYLRHVEICHAGSMRSHELFHRVKGRVDTPSKAIKYLAELETEANVYSAIFNADHVFWNERSGTRAHVATLLLLRVEQIRPLVFAAMRRFSRAELKKALSLFVSWSVRFLIAGGGRGGVLDNAYGKLAQEVHDGKITSASVLMKRMSNTVPDDASFEAAFATARVSWTALARYYLRTLELCARGDKEPEVIPNPDEAINLEHILPENPGPGWRIHSDIVDSYWKRIGNLVLMRAGGNTAIGNKPFSDKKSAFAHSDYRLTKEVSRESTWGENEIAARQQRLAKLAVKAWPLRP